MFKSFLRKFPIVAVIGPRQSGKTTLVRRLFPDYTYINLEIPAIHDFAVSDPQGFLETYKGSIILDEVQNVPDLFSYLQMYTDERKRMGEYILIGSQNFLLLEHVSRLLADRVAILNLLPFSYAELKGSELKADGWERFILYGGYPRIYEQDLSPADYYPNYLQNYVERDVRKLIKVSDLTIFRRFIQILAGRIGLELNRQSIGEDLGITGKTVDAWLSVLESSFIVFRLHTFYKNFGKRIIKSPKIYFYDTGLACNVLGIRSTIDLQSHFARGALFKNLVICEIIKRALNRGEEQHIYFWKDSNRNEVDLLIERGGRLIAMEIKSGKTVHDDFFESFHYLRKFMAGFEPYLIYGGEEMYVQNGVKVMGFTEMQDF